MITLDTQLTAQDINRSVDPHLGIRPVMTVYQLSINPFARVRFEKFVDIPTDTGEQRHYAFTVDGSLLDMGYGPEWIPIRCVDERGRAVTAGVAESLAQGLLATTIGEAEKYFTTSDDPLKNLSVEVSGSYSDASGFIDSYDRERMERILKDKNRHGRRLKH